MNSQARKIKRLQTDALSFVRASDPERALDKLAQLELLEPREPEWPRRAAECHRILGNAEPYLEALSRAAKAYVEMDLVVKAIAICKMMLAADPAHPAALAWMSQLRSPLGVRATAAPSRGPLLIKKESAAPAEPETASAVPPPNATRSLVAKKGLVAVARMVARKTARNPPPKSPSILVPASPVRPLERTQPVSNDRPPIAAAQPVEEKAPAVGEAAAQPVHENAPAVGEAAAQPAHENAPAVGEAAAQPAHENAPAVDEAIPDNAVLSSPPLAVEAELRLLVPGSCAWPETKDSPSGMFRLAIDEVERSLGEQTLHQARGILPAIPLFAEMDPGSLESLVRQSRLLHLRAGEVVFQQDDPPDCLYVVVNGSVAMVDEAANLELYRVGENEFFGEGALISNEPQPTTARAAEDCDLLAFGRDSVRACIVDNLSVVPVLLRFLRGRMLEHLVRTSPIFAHLDTAERRALSRKFEFIEVSEGASLIQQGTRSPGLFVLLSGAVDVVRRDGEREHWLATLERGGMFGEISLLGGSVAEADVRSVTSGFALMLPAAAFRDVIMTHPPLLEVLSAMSEERQRANQRRLPPASRRGPRRSPTGSLQ